jgi:hypothetical protein
MSTVLYQILNEEPPPPSQYSPGLPKGLDALVMRCLQKDPDRRHDDVPHLMRDLDNLLKERRREGGGLQEDLEAAKRTAVLTSAGTAPVAIPERPSTAPPVPAPAPPRRPDRFDDLELDSSFDGTRTPHSISTTQAIRSRGFAWGRWVAVVVTLAGLGLASWLHFRQQERSEQTDQTVADAGTVEDLAATEEDVGAPGSEEAVAEEPSETTPPEAETEETTTEEAVPEEPPPPVEGTLVLPAAWSPRIQVVIGESATPLRLDRERRVALPPGRYPLEFSLYEDEYSDARRIDATVEAGNETTVRIPIFPPAYLRVQPKPTSPSDSGFVMLGNRRLGPTGIAVEYKVAPGRYTLQIFRDLADEEPAITEPVELRSQERLVASFSYRTNDLIVNRSRVRDR